MKRHGQYYLYMVQCADGIYYTGYTNNLEARLKLHNNGNGAKFLRGRRPVELVYAKGYRYYKRVLQAERYLKRQSRKYKEALIRSHGIERS